MCLIWQQEQMNKKKLTKHISSDCKCKFDGRI